MADVRGVPGAGADVRGRSRVCESRAAEHLQVERRRQRDQDPWWTGSMRAMYTGKNEDDDVDLDDLETPSRQFACSVGSASTDSDGTARNAPQRWLTADQSRRAVPHVRPSAHRSDVPVIENARPPARSTLRAPQRRNQRYEAPTPKQPLYVGGLDCPGRVMKTAGIRGDAPFLRAASLGGPKGRTE